MYSHSYEFKWHQIVNLKKNTGLNLHWRFVLWWLILEEHENISGFLSSDSERKMKKMSIKRN